MSAGVNPFEKEIYPGTGETLGEYRIVRELGRGGCGVVFEALQARLDRPVAMKVVPIGEGGAFAGVGERFKREVDLIKRLEHPNIVRLYDYGEVGDDLLWMAMELVNGPELQSVMKTQGRLGPERTRRIVLQLLSALAEAHEIEVIHRDLKPSNIMLTRKGADHDVVKVVDFGIGKAIGKAEDKELQELTGEHGDLLGTPRYMAPEVLKGETIGPFSDVYAVGLILFEMLTDRPAVTGSTVYEVCAQQIYHDIRMPGWLEDTPFGELIRRATQKKTWDRYETALDFHEALSRITMSDEEFSRLLKESDEPLTAGFPKLDKRKSPAAGRSGKKAPPRFNFPTSKSDGRDASGNANSDRATGSNRDDEGADRNQVAAAEDLDGSGLSASDSRGKRSGAGEENSDPLTSGNVELNKLETGPVPEVEGAHVEDGDSESDEIAVEPTRGELAGGAFAVDDPELERRPPWMVPAIIAGAMIAFLLLILFMVGSGEEQSPAEAESADETATLGSGEQGASEGGPESESGLGDNGSSTGAEGQPGEVGASGNDEEAGKTTEGTESGSESNVGLNGTADSGTDDFEFTDEQLAETPANSDPATVSWAFDSQPTGAQVKVGGEVLCENTPCTVALDSSDESVDVWFYKRGYRGARTTLTPNASGEHTQKLRRRQRDNSGGDDDNGDPFNVRSFD